MPDLVPVTYREPFAYGKMPWRDARPHGESILEIVRSVPSLPRGFVDHGGFVCVNGEVVPRHLWGLVRPKPTSAHKPIAVTLHWPLHGGGGSGGKGGAKSIIAVVAAIALVVVTAALTGPFGASVAGAVGLGDLVVGGTTILTGAQILAGAVGIGGALAISALTAPPTTQTPATAADTNTDNKESASASGNVLARGGAIPRVVGYRKVFPPLVCEPQVELINENGDERVSATFALNGPHDLSDVRIDGNSITGMQDVTVDTRNGLPGDSAPTLITTTTKTNAAQIQLSQHVLDQSEVTITGTVANNLPKFHRVTTSDTPHQITLHLTFPGGLASGGGTATWAVPLRIRLRQVGTSTWINVPEIHLQASSTKQRKVQVLFFWGPTFSGWNLMVTNNGFMYAHRAPPLQIVGPTTPTQWVADSHFDTGSGNDYVYSGNEGSTRLKNMQLFAHSANIFMTGLPQSGRWEIEVMRGCGYLPGSFAKNSYSYGVNVLDFFYYVTVGGNSNVPQNQANSVSTIVLVRCISLWFENPFNGAVGKFACIQVQAVNRSVQSLSVLAAGRVGQWNGSNWTSVVGPTPNPAAHYRDVLLGAQNHDPLDSSLIDDTTLITWFNDCASHSWNCDAIIDDMRTQDVLSLLASCGYARPYQSDQYGVTIDKDRSSDPPVQVFSRANTSNMKFEKGFARVPAGLIVTYKNYQEDYLDQQLTVNQSNPSVGTTGLYESITYDGIVDETRATIRGQFDLDQANLRSTFYSFETDIESIVCRRGDLVAVQHDVLTLRAGDARIQTVFTSGGNITGLRLNSIIPCASGTGVAIRRSGGTVTTHAITNTTDTDTITFTTPFSIPPGGTIIGFDDTNGEYGCLVVSGDLATVYKRMLVFTIAPSNELKATITLVDEAPSLVRF